MTNCAIIIPVHEYNDTVKKYLINAIGSVVAPEGFDANIYVSCPKEISAVIGVDAPENVKIIDSTSDTSFQALVNNGVKNIGEDWFSILEFDDMFSSIWIKEFIEYSKHNPEVSVFMPLTDLIREIDSEKKMFVGYGNEAPLATAFSNELAYVDFDVLQEYFDFYLTGSFFNKADFVAVGGLKESMKLTFWYEFLLRLTHKGKKVRVVPKVGYMHLVNRQGSLFSIYRDTMTVEENKWWQKTAKEEYRYTEDRNKQYNKETKGDE